MQLRTAEARSRGDTTDYYDPAMAKDRRGLIYGAFHCPTGRWYMGQIINCINQRLRQHWWARDRDKDFFHLTLTDDPDLMVLLPFVLEYIPRRLWEAPTPHRAQWRKQETRTFR